MSTVRRADGDARSRAGAAVDTAAVLGVPQVRASFLDDVCLAARIEARNAAARHSWSNHTGTHRSEALINMFSFAEDDDLDDDDPEDEDEEVEEDEEDEGDEEVWQVRLT